MHVVFVVVCLLVFYASATISYCCTCCVYQGTFLSGIHLLSVFNVMFALFCFFL